MISESGSPTASFILPLKYRILTTLKKISLEFESESIRLFVTEICANLEKRLINNIIINTPRG